MSSGRQDPRLTDAVQLNLCVMCSLQDPLTKYLSHAERLWSSQTSPAVCVYNAFNTSDWLNTRGRKWSRDQREKRKTGEEYWCLTVAAVLCEYSCQLTDDDLFRGCWISCLSGTSLQSCHADHSLPVWRLSHHQHGKALSRQVTVETALNPSSDKTEEIVATCRATRPRTGVYGLFFLHNKIKYLHLEFTKLNTVYTKWPTTERCILITLFSRKVINLAGLVRVSLSQVFIC